MLVDRGQSHVKFLRRGLAVAVAPFQYIVNWPYEMSAWVTSSFVTHESLLQENAHLRAEQLLLKARLQQIIAIEKENRQLRALLQSSPRRNGKMIVAQILAVASNPFVEQVTLDKGSYRRVFVGQPVLDASGVMGQVIQVTPLTSQVLLITDRRSALPVQDSRTGIRLIANGQGDLGTLRLMNVPLTTDIKTGDVIVTSGLGERFPPGYPVGTVTRLSKEPGDEFANIVVTPSAHLRRSRLVLLLWPELSKDNKLKAAPTKHKQPDKPKGHKRTG
jgi:rod shape-determining protein MreC